jgi:hypothetical protein
LDPITLIAVVVGVVAAGGGAAVAARRGVRRRGLREAVTAPIPCGQDEPVSLFDLFWDLGANELSLAILDHQELLLEGSHDLPAVVDRLPAQVAAHGGYRSFVRENLEAIRELDDGSPPRKDAAALATSEQRLLPLAAELDERIATRAQLADTEPGPGEQIDVDQLLEADVLGMLGALLFGDGGGRGFKRWLALREARKLRDRLDDQLAGLYSVYAAAVQGDPDLVAHLYAVEKRWAAEATRIAALAARRPWRREPWADCADALVELAETEARRLGAQTSERAAAAVGRIDELAREGDKATAGYLLFVNRYAFFARNLSLCEAPVRAIEIAVHKLQQELRRQRRKGVI